MLSLSSLSGIPTCRSMRVRRFLRRTAISLDGWGGGGRRATLPLRAAQHHDSNTRLAGWLRFRMAAIPFGAAELALDEEKSFLNDAIRYFRSTGSDIIIIPSGNTAVFRTFPDGAAAGHGSTMKAMCPCRNI